MRNTACRREFPGCRPHKQQQPHLIVHKIEATSVAVKCIPEIRNNT